MDFGRDIVIKLEEIDFKLPVDNVVTSRTLSSSEHGDFELRIGTSTWGKQEWVGNFFPEGLKSKDYLTAYGERLNYLESGATFYRMPTIENVQSWYNSVKDSDIKFCLKVPQQITHIKRFKGVEELIQQFAKSANYLNDKLGGVFIQASEKISPKYFEDIITSLKNLVSCGFQDIFLELRHSDWFIDSQVFGELTKTLSELGVGMVITDTPLRREVLHMALPIPKVLIRFNGNGMHPVDEVRYKDWAKRLSEWKLKGLQMVYFGIHQTDPNDVPPSLELAKKIFSEEGLI